ncbi:MAG: 3-deoxy-manno-octulosonate cytidylyltransferase [Parvularculaceae bacterium]|nr:3-deoxy-manno-octulosonate cytidylyltransferase [Parvularculaceae bacterium]
MKTVIVIPARLHSTRLPQKLLLTIGGRTIIERTYQQARRSTLADGVVIATDAAEIADAARSFGAHAVMTRADHQSGTERIAEAALALPEAEMIVNIQGDEPEIEPAHIDALIALHRVSGAFASTLACPFPADLDPANPAAVKAILGKTIADAAFEALYFTRALAPFPRDGGGEFHLHIGAYAFRRDALMRFAAAPVSRLESIEKLEQLRILEMGEKIAVRVVDRAARGIDTQADYDAARSRIEEA